MAIVWGVAATFIAFELVALAGTSLASAYPQVFGRLVLSPDTLRSTACTLGPNERAVSGESPEASSGAWALGLGLGRDAVMRQFSSVTPELLTGSQAALQQIAGGLGVHVPSPFVPRQVANAHREFVSFIEKDPQNTAHQLALRYSPRACQLYKLGTLWGYSSMVRPVLPGERAVFAIEISYYARQTGLPERLWKPMLEATPRDAPPEQLMTETSALTDAVTTQLMRQR